MKTWILASLLAASLASAAAPFTPDTASLMRRNPAPEWFRDAKVGIYFHWGVYSVPAFGNEWYPCHMFETNRPEYRHHVATYGDPAKFGYTDFIPMFKAEKFDAEEWAQLFLESGMKFAGPVAEHHDNFSMWDSKVTPWNSVAMGPKRDITGELEKAIRARGMKFITTFHHEKCGIWEQSPGRIAGHYAAVKKYFPQILQDPKLAAFYGGVPREQYLKLWLDKLVEVIDRYQPDLIWHDAWMQEIPEPVRNQYLAHYFNRASEWGREVVVTVKGLDLPREIAVEDFEKGRAGDLTPYPWLTDDTISKGSWCYTKDLQIKDADEVIDTMIDIVSKNGQLLLNISPMADGTIPGDQRAVLKALGAWLKANGEAIYATRPWKAYGEGPTKMKKGGHFVGHVAYGAQDIRYTQSKDGAVLYATVLGNPAGRVTLGRVKVTAAAPDASVVRLCDGAKVPFTVGSDGILELGLDAPASHPSAEHAVAFRLAGFETALAAADQGAGISLTAAQAVLEGTQMQVEDKVPGRPSIGFWDDPSERIHWLLRVPAPGEYAVRLEYACDHASALKLDVEGRGIEAAVKPTGGWDKPAWADFGRIKFDRAGIFHVILSAKSPDQWSAVNVWQVRADGPR